MPVMLVSPWEWNSYGYEFMERAAAFGFGATNLGLHGTLRHIEKKPLRVQVGDVQRRAGAPNILDHRCRGSAPESLSSHRTNLAGFSTHCATNALMLQTERFGEDAGLRFRT